MSSSQDGERSPEARQGSPGQGGEQELARKRPAVWSIVAAVAFAVIVSACCLCGGLLYHQWPQFHQDPAAAEAMAREILSIEIPETFAPQGVIEWQVSFLLTMRGAYFSQIVSHGELTLLEVNSRFINQPEFRQHIVDSLRQHGAGSGFDLTVLQTETKSYEINGESVLFQFLTAEDRTTGRGRRIVDGVVPGRNGPVLVSLWVDEEVWDEKQITTMIESIGRGG